MLFFPQHSVLQRFPLELFRHAGEIDDLYFERDIQVIKKFPKQRKLFSMKSFARNDADIGVGRHGMVSPRAGAEKKYRGILSPQELHDGLFQALNIHYCKRFHISVRRMLIFLLLALSRKNVKKIVGIGARKANSRSNYGCVMASE